MKYRQLGNTQIQVSQICMGTMTYGEQNSEAEAFELLDYSLDAGVNFFDTAELYPIPPRRDTYGQTEEIIGNWLKARRVRDKVIIASKICGPGVSHIRNGFCSYDLDNLQMAVDASLKRLQTDYIDLYQLHWPDRNSNYFGHLGYEAHESDNFSKFEDTLGAIQQLIDQGKIRCFGLSNESAWGVMSYVHLAKTKSLPMPVTVQNPYSLLNRSYEVGLAEVSHRENIGLLAYSPLGFGVLSGKYLDGAKPEGARLSLFGDNYQRYQGPIAEQAVRSYVELAQQHKLDPAQMALAFVNNQPFVTSNIIGATNMEQLCHNIESLKVKLKADLLAEIGKIAKVFPYPCP